MLEGRATNVGTVGHLDAFCASLVYAGIEKVSKNA
jgi:hypothetical protein